MSPGMTEEAVEAGAASPHLDEEEQALAALHTAPRALIIHELVRQEGEDGLNRSVSALGWSGLAAGMSMGLSFLSLALLRAGLPDAPWRNLVSSFGYGMGFLLVILGRQQLFTETTVTAILPLLIRRDMPTTLAVLRFWGVVLTANVVGALLVAAFLTPAELFPEPVRQALVEVSRESVRGPFLATVLRSVFAGWLIASMVWILPSVQSARPFVILLITYIVALGGFSHTVAGSVEAGYLVFSGNGSVGDFLIGFFLPTVLGNTIGGVTLVALLNHAPLREELQGA